MCSSDLFGDDVGRQSLDAVEFLGHRTFPLLARNCRAAVLSVIERASASVFEKNRGCGKLAATVQTTGPDSTVTICGLAMRVAPRSDLRHDVTSGEKPIANRRELASRAQEPAR